MSQYPEVFGEDASRSRSSSNTAQPGRTAPPLVIVSERGRHSTESRRIVRAQAARASAAQSRVTRARNREERDGSGSVRETPMSPATPNEPLQMIETPIEEAIASPAIEPAQKPLVRWLADVLQTSPVALLNMTGTIVGETSATVLEQTGSALAYTGSTLTQTGSSLGGATGLLSSGLGGTLGGVGGLLGSVANVARSPLDIVRPQLPGVVPRGFATLQKRVQIPDNITILLSRTSCFDFASPGVEERLHQLLFDLIVGQIKAALSPISLPGHPIQGHLRVACTCLTIFQGQRADGQVFAQEPKYQDGLEAAWSEATLLDQNALTEPKSAEASLWAVFIISVTTGSTADFFHRLLHNLFDDLQLKQWSQVRSILMDFIYPGSFLDGPCQSFFDKVSALKIDMI